MDIPAPRPGPPDTLAPRQMREGPSADRLFQIELRSGRLARVISLRVIATYRGLLEGGLDAFANAHFMRLWVDWVEEHYHEPIHVVAPVSRPLPSVSRPDRPRERLPWMACVAELISDPLDPEMFQSRLTLVWWQDPSDDPARAWVERAAEGLDWEKAAMDEDLP